MTAFARLACGAILTHGILIGLACTVSDTDTHYSIEERVYDDNGNLIRVKVKTQNGQVIDVDVDDRLIDLLPGVVGGGKGDAAESADPPNEDEDAGPDASPSSGDEGTAEDDEPEDEVSGGSTTPVEPGNALHPGEAGPPPQPDLVDHITVENAQITLHVLKPMIDDSDELSFTFAWNTDLHPQATRLILLTFGHASMPDERTIAYAGPAPEGFDLAALLGVTRISLQPDALDVTFDDPAEEDLWNDTEALIIDISRADGTVRANGTTVLELTDSADALDALDPA